MVLVTCISCCRPITGLQGCLLTKLIMVSLWIFGHDLKKVTLKQIQSPFSPTSLSTLRKMDSFGEMKYSSIQEWTCLSAATLGAIELYWDDYDVYDYCSDRYFGN